MATDNKRTVEGAPVSAGEATGGVGKGAKVKQSTKEEKRPEIAYTAEELANAYKTFQTSYEIVKTALRVAKKDRATIAEAKEIIETFKNKEVK